MSANVTLRQWTDVVRRARLGRTVKAVALVLATYADADGSRVFPGVARLSYEAEVNYNTAKLALKKLRDAGLIAKVGRRGDADVYRLILAEDLDERCDVPTPAQVELELNALRGIKRGSYVPKPRDGEEILRPVSLAAESNGGTNLRPDSRAADSDICGPFDGPQEESAARLTHNLRPVSLAATTHEGVTEETTHSDASFVAERNPPRARGSETNDESAADVIDLEARRATLSPSRCTEHGLPAARCSFCRRAVGGDP